MKSWVRVLALVMTIAVLVVAAACSDGNSSLSGSQGNVRVVLTGNAAATAASQVEDVSLAAPGSTGEIQPGILHDRGDDDDDDDDQDGSGTDILSRLTEANATFASLLARNLDGQLIDLAIDLPRTVNLLGLAEGDTVELPMGTLPPGMYDQLVVVITELELVFVNGGKIALTPPGGGWTRIVRVQPFEVAEGAVTTLELSFRPRMAFRELAGGFGFFPDFDCHNR